MIEILHTFFSRFDIYYFFFSSRRRHTSWPRDWSSDVCSSDLFLALGLVPAGAGRAHEDLIATASCAVVDVPVVATSRFEAHVADRDAPCDERGQIRSEERRVGKECV